MRDLVLITLVLATGCAPAPCEAATGSASRAARLEPARPAGCREVAAGEPLQPLLDAAVDGDSFCLAPGEHAGPLALSGRVTLWGPPGAVVKSSGQGTTIRASGAVRLAGFAIDGSGQRYDLLDAAVHVVGDGGVVEGLSVDRAIYGILVERASHVSVRGNRVQGDARETYGLRGDPIRLWETTDSTVEGNDVEGGRDVVVWYSSRNRIADNRVRGGRYGTHLMYSHDNVVEHNVYEHDVVGVFVMYSHDVTVRNNLIAAAAGSAGIGIGLKDAGNVALRGNRLVQDTIGLYVDNSPAQLTQHDWIEGNSFHLCDVAVTFHAGVQHTHFAGNSFTANHAHVRVEGGGDAREVDWDGNYFDDYEGYDLDGDGVGDVPFELRSVSSELTGRYPQLAFFRGTPTLGLADAAGRLIPLAQPNLLLVDRRPRMVSDAR